MLPSPILFEPSGVISGVDAVAQRESSTDRIMYPLSQLMHTHMTLRAYEDVHIAFFWTLMSDKVRLIVDAMKWR